jgi:hypothetical protein
MNKILNCKISTSGFGFTNQIFCLITNIIHAHNEKKNIVVIDKFLNDFSRDDYTNISEVLNMDKINIYLNNKYNIILLDKFKVNLKINLVKYGNETTFVDITDFIISNCYKNNYLFISKDINLNEIKGDPIPNHLKKIYIYYSINDYDLTEELQENCTTLENNFIIDLSINTNDDSDINFGWINTIDKVIFEDLLKHIYYNKYFIDCRNNFIKNINLKNKINILHLRLEDDAINHWSSINNMTNIEFKNYIENKYINIIKKYITPDEGIIILTSSSSNEVIEFLKNNNYNYKLTTKFFDERDKNAIVDLLISKICNNIFIGNFNLEKLNGSTYSYYITQHLNSDVKKILIDLDRIKESEILN